MKKTLKLLVVSLLVLLIANPVTVKADMGPKPSIVIDFGPGFSEPYYVTLLTPEESIFPYEPYDEEYDYPDLSEEERMVVRKFGEFAKSDEFNFMMNFENCTKSNSFSWTYRVPTHFKLLIYLVDSDSFIETGEIEKYAFDAYYRFDYENHMLIEDYRLGKELISLACRIILTILVEIVVALMFGFKGRLKPIVITNIITQLILNLYMSVVTFYAGMLSMMLTVFIIELAVIIIEMIVYGIVYRKWKAVLYAIVANLASFVVGLQLAAIIPALF